MSLHTLATHMAQHGRGPDSMLVHMSPREVQSLQALAKATGGTLTLNPHTGLPEAGWLDKLFPALAGFALDMFVPGLGEAIGGALGTSAAVGTGIAVGGITGLATGSLQQGLMAGLGAYGGAGLSAGLTAAGIENIGASQLSAANAAADPIAALAEEKAALMPAAGTPGIDTISKGFDNVTSNPSSALQFVKDNGKSLLAATSPMLAGSGVQTTTPIPQTPSYYRPFMYDPQTQGLQALTPVSGKGIKKGGLLSLANGGAVAFADGGSPDDQPDLFQKIYGRAGTAEEQAAMAGKSAEEERAILQQSIDAWNQSHPSAAPQAQPQPQPQPQDQPQAQAQAAAPTSSPDANAAPQITDEQRKFIDWQAKQNDPMQQGIIADEWARAGITDPYSNATLIKNAQAAIDNANRRIKETGGTDVAQWNDPNWQKYLGTNKDAFNIGTQVKNDPAFAAQFSKQTGLTGANLNAWVTAATDPYAAAVQNAGTPSKFTVGGGGGSQSTDTSQIRRPGQAITEGENYSRQYTPDQLTGLSALWTKYGSDPTAMKQAMQQYGITADDIGLATGQSKTQLQKYFGDTSSLTGDATKGTGLSGLTDQSLNATSAFDMLDTQGRRQFFSDWAKQHDVYGMSSPGMTADDGSFTPWATKDPLTVAQSKALDASWVKAIADYNKEHPFTSFSLDKAKPDVPAAGGTPTANASGIQTLTNANALASNTPPRDTPAPSGIQQLTKDGHLVDPTTGHLLNPTLTAAQLSEAKGNMPEMQSAYQAYWDSVKPGDILDFAGGTLTRNTDGTATHTYTDANGKKQSYTFNQNTDFSTVAKSDPNIAKEWKDMFNYAPPKDTGAPIIQTPGPTQTSVPTGGSGTAGSATTRAFNWQQTPIDRLPTVAQKKPEEAMSGESLAAYNALFGKGSTATKAWTTYPGRNYLPNTGQGFYVQHGGAASSSNPTSSSSSTTDKTQPTTEQLNDKTTMPSQSPGEGYHWVWIDSPGAKHWVSVPIEPDTTGGSSPGGAANGGLMGYAGGGLGSLGGYSDGGRLLRGPGDGVSDSIPASIGNRQPARLADGEFVVPARIVSELGNGSTEAGARRLYQMMDRVQNARKKSVGKGNVAKNSRAEQYLPA